MFAGALARILGFGGGAQPAPAPAAAAQRPECPLTGVAKENADYLRASIAAPITLMSNRVTEWLGADSEGRFRSGPDAYQPPSRNDLHPVSISYFIRNDSRFIFGIPPELSQTARTAIGEALTFRYAADFKVAPERIQFYLIDRSEPELPELGTRLDSKTFAPKAQEYSREPVPEKAKLIDYASSGGFELMSKGLPMRLLEVIPVDSFFERAGMTKPHELQLIGFVLCEKPGDDGKISQTYVALETDNPVEILGRDAAGKALGFAPDSRLVLTFTQDFQIAASFRPGRGQALSLLQKI